MATDDGGPSWSSFVCTGRLLYRAAFCTARKRSWRSGAGRRPPRLERTTGAVKLQCGGTVAASGGLQWARGFACGVNAAGPPGFKRAAASCAVTPSPSSRHRHRSSAAGRTSSLGIAGPRSADAWVDAAGRADHRDAAAAALAQDPAGPSAAVAGAGAGRRAACAVCRGDLARDESATAGSDGGACAN